MLYHILHIIPISRNFSSTSLGVNSPDTGVGPLKARSKMSVRKSSVENLLDDKPAAPVRSSSLENIHALSKQQSLPGLPVGGKGGGRSVSGGMGGKIVDAVVKVYQPDHSHKYLDISPVSLCFTVYMYVCMYVYTYNLYLVTWSNVWYGFLKILWCSSSRQDLSLYMCVYTWVCDPVCLCDTGDYCLLPTLATLYHLCAYVSSLQTTTIAELIQQGVKEFYPDKFVVAPAE